MRGAAAARFSDDRILPLNVAPGRHLAALGKLIEAGEVKPVIDRTYPLSQVPEAIRYLEAEHARAKVAISVR
jgi:NADPH:quinone reductase-like Zn-dependent oxidoreductase